MRFVRQHSLNPSAERRETGFRAQVGLHRAVGEGRYLGLHERYRGAEAGCCRAGASHGCLVGGVAAVRSHQQVGVKVDPCEPALQGLAGLQAFQHGRWPFMQAPAEAGERLDLGLYGLKRLLPLDEGGEEILDAPRELHRDF